MGLSRRTYVEGKRYETVLFQENTHPGDFEMVELQDATNREREALAQNLIVDGFFGDSFKVVGAALSNAVNVTPGPGGYSAGRRLILPDTLHPLVSGQYIYNMAIATPVTNRTDLVYLDIFIETVTAAVDPDIQDPILGPSALRERVRYNFAVAQNVSSTTVPTLPVGHVGLPLALITRRASDPLINAADVVDARTLASLNPQFKAQRTIVVSPAGGDFNNPATAVASVAGLSSAATPYTILVMPGVYTIATPMNFNSPYVSMIGTDPDACVIKGNFTGLSTAQISADHIVLRNLSLDYASGSGGHASPVFFNGAYTATLDNLILGAFYYNENAVNSFNGLDTVLGGNVTVRRCQIYAQNTTTTAAVRVGASSTVDMLDCTITAAASDALSLANGGGLTLNKCSFISNRTLITSSGTMTAKNCSWAHQTVKAFTTTGNSLVFTLGVTNTMTDCSIIDGAQGNSSCQDTSLLWKDVICTVQLAMSGGGVSVFENVKFGMGLDLNGTAASFIGCNFPTSPGSWAIGGSNGEAMVIRGTTTPVYLNCLFTSGTCVLVLGGSPRFFGCRFTSGSSSAKVINVVSTSTDVIVDGCLIQLTASYSLSSPIFIGGSGGTATFSYTHCHVEGLAGGQPDYVLRGSGTGATLRAGGNTSTAGALREPTTITSFSNILQTP